MRPRQSSATGTPLVVARKGEPHRRAAGPLHAGPSARTRQAARRPASAPYRACSSRAARSTALRRRAVRSPTPSSPAATPRERCRPAARDGRRLQAEGPDQHQTTECHHWSLVENKTAASRKKERAKVSASRPRATDARWTGSSRRGWRPAASAGNTPHDHRSGSKLPSRCHRRGQTRSGRGRHTHRLGAQSRRGADRRRTQSAGATRRSDGPRRNRLSDQCRPSTHLPRYGALLDPVTRAHSAPARSSSSASRGSWSAKTRPSAARSSG